jgi:hypothetical protein
MLDFYKTAGGRRFIDHTLPDLILQLQRVHVALNRVADALEATRADVLAQVESDTKEGR